MGAECSMGANEGVQLPEERAGGQGRPLWSLLECKAPVHMLTLNIEAEQSIRAHEAHFRWLLRAGHLSAATSFT